MKMQFIDLKEQYQRYKKEIDEKVGSVLASAKYILGPEVSELEENLAEYVGVSHCLTTSSGTDSLLIALMALGIGKGDEVITTPFTFISPAQVTAHLGAKPVFVDIDPRTYNIDASKIEEAITDRTKAIIPVSLFGQMPDFDQINDIAKRHNLVVIEDGAQSFGATQGRKKSCSVTKIGTTSFFPAKPLGCYGDGGAIFTNDDELAKKMKAIRTHGSFEKYHHVCEGINGRFDTIQAAIMLAKWPHYEDELRKREEVAHFYNEALKDHYEIPFLMEGNTHVYAQYTIGVEDREQFISYMNEAGIPTAIYYPSGLHEQKVFNQLGYKKGDFPVTENATKKVVSLPMHPFMSEEDLRLITETAKTFHLCSCQATS